MKRLFFLPLLATMIAHQGGRNTARSYSKRFEGRTTRGWADHLSHTSAIREFNEWLLAVVETDTAPSAYRPRDAYYYCAIESWQRASAHQRHHGIERGPVGARHESRAALPMLSTSS